MQESLVYLLKMSGCSGVLLLYYYLFLRNKQFHQYNRFYLILSVVMSFVLPFINIPVPWEGEAKSAPLYIRTLDAIALDPILTASSRNLISRGEFMVMVYLLISLIVFSGLILSILKVQRICRKYDAEKVDDIVFYNTDEKNAPFSFMNKIFWSRALDLNSEKGQQVFRHELYHIMQRHSVDLIFMQIVISIAWINPFFYFIKKELATIHEFLADQFAVSDNDRYSYAEFLVTDAIKQKQVVPITHYFFNSPLKRRIAMILLNRKTSNFSYARRLMSIPLIMILFCSLALKAEIKVNELIAENRKDKSRGVEVSEKFSVTGMHVTMPVEQASGKPSGSAYKPVPRQKIPDGIAGKRQFDTIPKKVLILKRDTLKLSDPLFTQTEVEAKYPGEISDWRRYLSKTFRYPQDAINKEIQGTVVVQFIVDESGNVSNVEATSGPKEGGLREEAIRLIENSGKWIPAMQNGHKVRAYKKQPITFKLEKQDGGKIPL